MHPIGDCIQKMFILPATETLPSTTEGTLLLKERAQGRKKNREARSRTNSRRRRRIGRQKGRSQSINGEIDMVRGKQRILRKVTELEIIRKVDPVRRENRKDTRGWPEEEASRERRTGE